MSKRIILIVIILAIIVLLPFITIQPFSRTGTTKTSVSAAAPSSSLPDIPNVHTATTSSQSQIPQKLVTLPPITNAVASVDPGQNPIANPSLETQGTPNTPLDWLQGHSGNNIAQFVYPVSGHDSANAAQTIISSYSSGQAEWYFKAIPANGNEAYAFSDYYRSNTSTIITVQFTAASGATSYTDIAKLPPAADWTQASGNFLVPDGTISLTVLHILQSTGTLAVDDYALSRIAPSFSYGMVSLDFDDGWKSAYDAAFPILKAANMPGTFYIITHSLGDENYMSASDVLNLQAAGEEIGAHTRTHPHLPQLSASDMQSEIAGSMADLKAIGIQSVSTFAYPYGAYNAETDAIVRQAGYAAARTVEPGMNFPESNIYLLKAHTITNDTSVAQVEQWIDEAVRDKEWVILLFHEFDTHILTGDSYTWSSSDFQQIVDYLAQNKIPVVTNAQAAATLKS